MNKQKKQSERQIHINKIFDSVFDEPFGKKREVQEKRNKKSKPQN